MAQPRPIPLAPPVTIATEPASSPFVTPATSINNKMNESSLNSILQEGQGLLSFEKVQEKLIQEANQLFEHYRSQEQRQQSPE